MATIPYPDTDYMYSKVRGGYTRSQGVSVCPYSQQRLVQDWGGKVKKVEVILPPMQGGDAATWSQFFEDLNGMANVFVLDVTDIFPHEPGATNVTFRLDNPNTTWDAEEAMRFGFTFTATEVV